VDLRYLNFSPTRPRTDGPGRCFFPGAPIGRKNLDTVLQCMAEADPASALGRVKLEISGAREEDFPTYAKADTDPWTSVAGALAWAGATHGDAIPFADASAIVYRRCMKASVCHHWKRCGGHPVVASNRGSLPEVLGDAALTIDQRQASTWRRARGRIVEAEVRARFANGRLRQARLFTWDKCAQKTGEVYREVLAAAAVPL